jgi:hypothetical protein
VKNLDPEIKNQTWDEVILRKAIFRRKGEKMRGEPEERGRKEQA